MRYQRISADCHIDLPWIPPDLFSSNASAALRDRMPYVKDGPDGPYWTAKNGTSFGLWGGVGPAGQKYEPGKHHRVDVMAATGLYDDGRQGIARPTTPELRLADLDRDGVDAEIIYGCLMINDLIATGEMRAWANAIYNDWAADFARRSDPTRVFPLAIIPNNDPIVAAAEIRRCAKMGLKGGDLAFKRMTPPMYQHEWYPMWEAAAECHFPISFHSTGFKAVRAPDTPEMEQKYMTQWRLVRSSLFQLDTMEVLVSVIASGACEKYPDLRFVLGESGVTWLPYVFDRLDTEYEDRARSLGFKLKPSDYFRRQGYVTYQQDQYLEPIVPLIGEDNIIWGTDYPHPDCVWPESRAHLQKNLSGFSASVQRKITCDNVVKLYNLPERKVSA